MHPARLSLVFLLTLCLLAPASAQGDGSPTCAEGTSTEDRLGCLDSDGDGWSDPDEAWNESMGADAFPDNATEHRDLDGDGIGDVADPDMDGDGSLDDVDVWPSCSFISRGRHPVACTTACRLGVPTPLML